MLLVGLVALVVLGFLARQHVGLAFVDFIGFSIRAQALPEVGAWHHPQYPIGYPALLALVTHAVGDVLVAGRIISVVAGVALVGGVARLLGAGAALFVLVPTAVLSWGSTEGTDMLAAALCLWSVAAAAERRPRMAGLWLGLAFLVRHTALAALPVVLLAGPLRVIWVFVLATMPHWTTALAVGGSVLPDQQINLAIGAGGHVPFWTVDTLVRLPAGAARTLMGVGADPWLIAGTVGLALGLWGRDRRAWMLAGWGLGHLVALSLTHSNPRLALPLVVVAACGSAWALPVRLLVPVALVGIGLQLRGMGEVPKEAELRQSMVEACADLEGTILSTTPWFHRRSGGWILGTEPAQALPTRPHLLTPDALHRHALEGGHDHVVLTAGRVHQTFPKLRPLMGDLGGSGFSLVARKPGWRVLKVEP